MFNFPLWLCPFPRTSSPSCVPRACACASASASELPSKRTPQKIRWSNRARVVFPLEDGPDIPTIRVWWSVTSSELAIISGWVEGRESWAAVVLEVEYE